MKKLLLLLALILSVTSCVKPEAYDPDPSDYAYNPTPLNAVLPFIPGSEVGPRYPLKVNLLIHSFDYLKSEDVDQIIIDEFGGDYWEAISEIADGYEITKWKSIGNRSYYTVKLSGNANNKYKNFYNFMKDELGTFMLGVHKEGVNTISYLYSLSDDYAPDYVMTVNSRGLFYSKLK